MQVLKIIIGIISLLLALFAGGCSLLIIADLLSGVQSSYVGIEAVLLIGILPAAFGALIAWLCFRKPRNKPDQD